MFPTSRPGPPKSLVFHLFRGRVYLSATSIVQTMILHVLKMVRHDATVYRRQEAS
jgi:hypothetical protein